MTEVIKFVPSYKVEGSRSTMSSEMDDSSHASLLLRKVSQSVRLPC